jgi:hypothetical protein
VVQVQRFNRRIEVIRPRAGSSLDIAIIVLSDGERRQRIALLVDGAECALRLAVAAQRREKRLDYVGSDINQNPCNAANRSSQSRSGCCLPLSTTGDGIAIRSGDPPAVGGWGQSGGSARADFLF